MIDDASRHLLAIHLSHSYSTFEVYRTVDQARARAEAIHDVYASGAQIIIPRWQH